MSGQLVREAISQESMLMRYLRCRGLQPADAEDIRQETYLRLLEHRDAGEVRSAKAFALRTARNLTIDHFRSARARWVRLTGDLSKLDGVDALDPERHALAASGLAAFFRALQVLPVRRRTAFVMRRIENRSLLEIAASMGISVSAVEKHLTLALCAFGNNALDR